MSLNELLQEKREDILRIATWRGASANKICTLTTSHARKRQR